ncbi:MAG: hypothetical protein CM1200mP35_09450 [Chloroflexota bacterium]|nr:MAG: hypothetical protein CM1200mP35_09450 [Chloroflexota bacterium]
MIWHQNSAAGFNIERSVTRTRGPGPETATVALDVRPYSEHQRPNPSCTSYPDPRRQLF